MAASKGMAVYEHNGEEYNVNDPNIADEFSSSKKYVKNDYVYHAGKLYRFKTSHTAGSWNANHVDQVLLTDNVKVMRAAAVDQQEIAMQEGVYQLNIENFDLGNATGDSNGFIYSDDNTRVRTRPGYVIHLSEGFTIAVANSSTARFFFHRRNPDGSYTHSNWYTLYRTVTEGDYVFTIEGIPASAQTSPDALFSQFSIVYAETNKEQMNRLNEKTYGNVYIPKIDLELGNMGISNSGWSYVDAENRVRMREGVTLHMYAGDSFGLTDYTKYHYFYGYRTMSGTYTAGAAWMTSGVVADEECDLVFIIEKLTEANIWDIDEIYKLIRFQRGTSQCKVSYDFKALGLRSINHQGYNSIAPRNTLPAFALSKVMGFDFVETDVRFSSDNVPVLCHDATIDATSDGTGTISQMTYAQLLTYDFGSWKSAEYAGTKIPTLEQLFALCNTLNLYPYAEVMEGMTKAQAKICVDAARKYNMLRGVTWISFSFDSLRLIVNEDPGARVLLIVTVGDSTNFVRKAMALSTGYNEVGVDMNYTLGSTYWETALRFDMPIETWTVDTEANIEALPEYVRGVTSNKFPANRVREKQKLTLAKPSITSSRIANISGGYSVDDEKVTMTMTFTGNAASENTVKVGSGLPAPKRVQAVTILSMSGTSITEKIAGYISTSGELYMEKLASGTSYTLTGVYSLI